VAELNDTLRNKGFSGGFHQEREKTFIKGFPKTFSRKHVKVFWKKA
jgi:hypothetical protein